MDAFYASVEIRDNPDLAGKPVVVGGPPNSRSVVTTASYEARKFGIRSAMPCSQAYRLCPNAIFIRPHFEKYRAVSQKIREIFRKYTDLVEPLSLDEAYLDVTQNAQGLYAVKIAKLIRDEVRESLNLTGSAGVAPNKLVAKIASDIHKPDGLTVVLPEQVREFMRHLPLRKIHGVGPATEKRLLETGLRKCEDVWNADFNILENKFGSFAKWIRNCSYGIDERPVEVSYERKSLGREETFAKDLIDKNEMVREIRAISESVASSLRKKNLRGKTITLKVRFHDFVRITRSRSVGASVNDAKTIARIGEELILGLDITKKRVRLLGISVSRLDA